MPRRNDKSKTVFVIRHKDKLRLGLFRWGKKTRGIETTRGWTLRVLNLGHLSFSVHANRLTGAKRDGRRNNHGITIAWWGVTGRRRKKSFQISLHI